jgi:hypothetical protein
MRLFHRAHAEERDDISVTFTSAMETHSFVIALSVVDRDDLLFGASSSRAPHSLCSMKLPEDDEKTLKRYQMSDWRTKGAEWSAMSSFSLFRIHFADSNLAENLQDRLPSLSSSFSRETFHPVPSPRQRHHSNNTAGLFKDARRIRVLISARRNASAT